MFSSANQTLEFFNPLSYLSKKHVQNQLEILFIPAEMSLWCQIMVRTYLNDIND